MSAKFQPIELPPQGKEGKVQSAFPTVFNWDYQIDHAELMRLYEKGKTMQWNAATDIDWSIDVDPERVRIQDTDALDAILNPPEKLEPRRHPHVSPRRWILRSSCGEQGAVAPRRSSAQNWMEAGLPQSGGRGGAAYQVYQRYPAGSSASAISEPPPGHSAVQVIGESRWDESLGITDHGRGWPSRPRLMKFTQPTSAHQQITTYVMRARPPRRLRRFSLQDLYTREMSSTELKEREEFVIEATVLMRDRLLMAEVWERIGLDPKIWMPWSLNTPFMVGFRQILFSKIVPNLKRLGLLTPRVRQKFAELNILEFESLPDSTEEEETAIPPALMTFFHRLQQAGVQLPWANR
jgi:hypothetical protein